MNALDQLRVGYGYDVHRLITSTEGLILGGIRIPYHKKAQAHSDGDVLLHAMCDAFLGAASLGDLGLHFPDTDNRWRNIASRQLVTHTLELVQQEGFRLINIDATIMLQEPSLAPYKEAIGRNIANLLALSPRQLNIKATTGEGLDAIGKGKAIAAQCVCLLRNESA